MLSTLNHKKQPPTWKIPDKDEVIPIIKAYCKSYRKKIDSIAVASSSSHDVIPECPNNLRVKDLPLKEVIERIKAFQQDIIDGNDMELVSRGSSNQIFVSRDDVDYILLKNKDARYEPSEYKKQVVLGLLDLILMFCEENKHYTLRSLYYMDTKLFKQQAIPDSALDDVCCVIGCNRSNLNVFASDRGHVGGVLTFKIDEFEFDCRKMGTLGQPIPPFLDELKDIQIHDALFILFVEKHTAFVNLMEDKFYEDYPCIIITGMGMPDVTSRRFMNFLSINFKLPTFAVGDCDPDGLQIISVCAFGSEKMSYDSKYLATPDITWLGILPTDLETLQISSEDMSQADLK